MTSLTVLFRFMHLIIRAPYGSNNTVPIFLSLYHKLTLANNMSEELQK